MRKILLITFLTLGIWSCDILKQSTKDKKDIEFTETIETQEVRKGDTVTYIVPVIRYKDTVITTVSTQGTILKTYYDNQGNVSQSDCISSEIELLRLEMRNLSDQSLTKEKSKEEKIGMDLPLIIGGVVCFAILLLFFYMNAQTKKLTSVMSELKNKL